MRSMRAAAGVAAAVMRRPELWGTALAAAWRCVPDRWWARKPFLPVPPRAFVEFRVHTHTGGAGRASAADLVRYLEWCRANRSSFA